MERMARWALALIVILNVLATWVAFEESYAGLYQWAKHHTIAGFNAGVWPLMIDTILVCGEAALFYAHHAGWNWKSRLWAWTVTLVTLGVSVATNTGHVETTDWLSRVTAALPPAALAFCLTVGLGVMKRFYAGKTETPSQPLTENPSQPLTQFVRTSPERAHVGTMPWIEMPAGNLSGPLTESETPAETEPAETLSAPPESVAMALPESLEPTETFARPDFKVIPGKSFTLPQDSRQGLELPEVRVRDMLDVDPDISVNAIKKALGCAWATADKYLKATKEARGLPVS